MTEKIKRLSNQFEAIQKLTKSGGFINCFDRYAVLLYINNNSNPPEKRVRFSDLSQYIKQSDVYLANLLKEGVETEYIKIHICPEDKRRKSYELTKKSLAEINSILGS